MNILYYICGFLEYDLHLYTPKKSEDQKVSDLNGIINNIKEIRPTVPVSLKKANSRNSYVKDQAYSWTVIGKKDLIFQVVIVINYNGNLFPDEGLWLRNTKFRLHIQVPNGNICNVPAPCKGERCQGTAVVV